MVMKEAHQHTDTKEDAEFAGNLDALRKAEEEAKEIVKKAHEKSETTLKSSREKAEGIVTSARDEAVAQKDRLLLESRKDMEAENARVMKDAGKEAEVLSKKKLKPEDVRKMAASVFE